MVRGLLYILLPLSTIIAILLISQGVVQTFSSGMAYNSLEGENLWLYLGPVASQVAIKQLGTNGGGFLGPIRPIHLRIRRFFKLYREFSHSPFTSCADFCFGFWVKTGNKDERFYLFRCSSYLPLFRCIDQ